MSFQVSCIYINYFSKDKLIASIESIVNNVNVDLRKSLEFIIINNSIGQKLEKADFEKYGFEVSLINNSTNLGFAKAANQGAKIAKGEYLLFLNPDTVCQMDFISSLIEFYQKNAHIGFISPSLMISPNESQLFAYGYNENFFKLVLSKIKYLFNFKQQIIRKESENFLVDWISGAAMFVSKNRFQEIGGFDERFFMYFEDKDICLRAQKLGFSNYVLGDAQIIHLGGRFVYKHKSHFEKAQFEFNKKYYGRIYAKGFKFSRQCYNIFRNLLKKTS